MSAHKAMPPTFQVKWKILLLRILRVISILAMPLVLVSVLMLFNVVNPMAIAFLTTFTVRNQSGEVVSITPIGTVGKAGHRRLLPISPTAYLSIPAGKVSMFRLEPGEECQITYDWDDVHFSEIAVQSSQGEWRQLVVDANPTERQYRRPATDLFIIPPVSQLPVASGSVVRRASLEGRNISILWIGVPPGLLVLWLYKWSTRRLRSLREA